MKIIQLHFCVLLLCGAAESFTDKLVDLGQNVTLNCGIDVKNVYWFLIKPSHPLVYILRSFTNTPAEPSYYVPAFRERFSVQYNSSLFIQNITLNELGIYYCTQNDTPPRISNGTRLHIKQRTEESSSDLHSQTEENRQLQNQTHKHEEIKRDQQTLLIISGLVNCVLVTAVIGAIISHCKGSPNNQLQPSNFSQQQHPESNSTQNLFSVMLQEGVQTGRRSSTFTVVEFTQLSPVL